MLCIYYKLTVCNSSKCTLKYVPCYFLDKYKEEIRRKDKCNDWQLRDIGRSKEYQLSVLTLIWQVYLEDNQTEKHLLLRIYPTSAHSYFTWTFSKRNAASQLRDKKTKFIQIVIFCNWGNTKLPPLGYICFAS